MEPSWHLLCAGTSHNPCHQASAPAGEQVLVVSWVIRSARWCPLSRPPFFIPQMTNDVSRTEGMRQALRAVPEPTTPHGGPSSLTPSAPMSTDTLAALTG